MAEVLGGARGAGPEARPEASAGKSALPPETPIPDIIEERRKDAEGRVCSYKYLRGKLLGKVSWPLS